MMIFKKAIPRRTFLRGVGATLALPLLDGMIPAFGAPSATPTRLSFVYTPNGKRMELWTPKTGTPAAKGAGFELTPTLEPLAPFKDQMLVLSGLSANEGRRIEGEVAGDHSRASGSYLTGAHPRQTPDKAVAGVSMDQIAARELGKQTQLASLELGIENEVLGSCEAGYSCVYANTISWRTPTTPMPVEPQPRAVFERLFGDSDSTNPAERLAQIRENRSILDFVTKAANRLSSGLGPSDRNKINEYLEAIRDVERRIQLAEEQSSRELPELSRPAGIPARFDDHAKIMFDLQVLAFQSDMTRVSTFMTGHEMSGQAFPEIGVPDPHHAMTHHNGDPEKIGKVIEIDRYQSQVFSYFIEKLRATPDGDGTLLDHAMVVYGGALSDGNMHYHNNLPLLLLGGGSGHIQGGRHVVYPQDTPVANLWLALLEILGIPLDRLGDSTGKLTGLAG
jgi:hypothetical protein